jgi:membrane protein YqaA with SNARE-associated domain
LWFASKFATWAAKVLLPLGGQGLFLAAVLDSSFIPLPEGVDLWLITLSVMQPHKMPYYSFVAIAGSVIGCCVLYFVARWSEETFERNPKYKGLPRVRRWVDKYEFLAVLGGSILPPPMPFKLVVLASGLAKGRFDKFLFALVIGRTVRYVGEGILAVRYGNKLWPAVLKNGPIVFGVTVALIIVVFLIRRSKKVTEPEPTHQSQ